MYCWGRYNQYTFSGEEFGKNVPKALKLRIFWPRIIPTLGLFVWVILGWGWVYETNYCQEVKMEPMACVCMARRLRMAFMFFKGCENSQTNKKASVTQTFRTWAQQMLRVSVFLAQEWPTGLQVCKINCLQTDSQEKRQRHLFDVSFMCWWEGVLHRKKRKISQGNGWELRVLCYLNKGE